MEKIDFNKKWVVTRLDNPEDIKVVDVPYDAMFYEVVGWIAMTIHSLKNLN